MNKVISEVHLYQGVKFGNSVIKYVLLDSAYSDAGMKQGNTAEVVEGIGVRIFNNKRDEDIVVPFNNVAYFKYVKIAELKKAK